MLLFRAFFLMLETIIEIRGTLILKEKHFPANGNHFLWFSCQKKQFCRIVKTYFSTNASFRLFKKSSTNHFSYFFRDSCRGKLFFLSSGNVFLNESFIPATVEGFFSNKDRYFTWKFFLLSETIAAMSGNQFLKTELILAGGNWFSS